MNKNKKIRISLILDQISQNNISIKEDYNSKQWIDGLIKYLKKKQKQKRLKLQQSIKAQTTSKFMNNHIFQLTKNQDMIEWQQKFTLLLAHFNFCNIKILSLSNCNINNCQFLEFIQMPIICNLQLNNNKITNFKPLIKMNFYSSLNVFDMEQNLSAQVKIQRIKLTELKGKNAHLLLTSKSQIVNQDISHTAKMQTIVMLTQGLFDQQHLCKQERIKQRKTGKILFKKYDVHKNH